MRNTIKSLAMLLLVGGLHSCTSAPVDNATTHIANLPTPPTGYKWVINEEFSDEFEGTELNSERWHAKSPFWTNGRPPAQFLAENVSVSDGYLKIRNTVLPEPQGNDGKPGNKYTLGGGAVASVSTNALYGYYETRMKASMTTMSSTFWLTNKGEIITEKDSLGNDVKIRVSQELDIIETMGVVRTLAKGEKSWNYNFNQRFNANAHYWRRSSQVPTEDITSPRSDVERTETDPSGEDFHTYGCWWVDAQTVKFYYDGNYMYTIHPSQKYTDTPFENPMFMHLVTETYDWEPGVPTAEDLADAERATTKYDWVRSYKLVKE